MNELARSRLGIRRTVAARTPSQERRTVEARAWSSDDGPPKSIHGTTGYSPTGHHRPRVLPISASPHRAIKPLSQAIVLSASMAYCTPAALRALITVDEKRSKNRLAPSRTLFVRFP